MWHLSCFFKNTVFAIGSSFTLFFLCCFILMIDFLSPEEIADIVHVDLVCWKVVGGKQNESLPFHPYRQLRFKQEVFMVCIYCSELLFLLLFIKKVVFWYVWKSTMQAPDCSSFRILDSWNGIRFRTRAWKRLKAGTKHIASNRHQRFYFQLDI